MFSPFAIFTFSIFSFAIFPFIFYPFSTFFAVYFTLLYFTTDLFFLIGANPSSNHPRLLTKIKNIRRRGGKVIVINPVIEKGLVNFSIPSNLKS